jgi:hypothetical protein
MENNHYPGLSFGPVELSKIMRITYDELIAFITTPSFSSMRADLMRCSKEQRPEFVMNVILSPTERGKRGIVVPDKILIETSAFGDRRPTLFVVKKFLPKRYHGAWENVNITFDDEYNDADVSRDPTMAWRPPLPVVLQNAAMANNIPLDALPNDNGVGCAVFKLPKIGEGER